MIPIILAIVFLIALVWILFHTKPTEVLRYNTKCEKCGRSKGIFKCQMCRVQIMEIQCTCPQCGEEFEQEFEIDPNDFNNDRD